MLIFSREFIVDVLSYIGFTCEKIAKVLSSHFRKPTNIHKQGKMAKARNRVIAGDYNGKIVGASFSGPYIALSLTKFLDLNSSTVESAVQLDDESQINVASAAMRGLVGELILGPVGLVAAATAKRDGIHTVGIQFKDGKRCVVEVNDNIYKAIRVACF